MSIKRRDFFKIAGGLSLCLPLYDCVVRQMDDISKSKWLSPVESWVPTVCRACSGGCGILVRVLDERAVKIEGNPLHPLNRGRVCPKGQAGLQLLYSPERVQTPLKRVGGRNSGRWHPISWPDALYIVTSKLKELRDSGKSHTVVFVGQDFQNTTEELIERFLNAYGSPNYIRLYDWVALRKSYYLTQGIPDLLAYDLEHSRYVLSFGADFLANWPTSMENQRIYGNRRANRDIKIVQVEPRFSLSASRADRWIPINPGTQAFLALGISSVIIKENLYEETFLDRFASGFEDFKNVIVKEIRLDNISDLTGVPLQRIIEIAKEFATHQPAVAVADYNLSFLPNGLFTALVVHSLNALVGNIDRPGGILRQRRIPMRELPAVKLDASATRGLSQPRMDGLSKEERLFFEEKSLVDNILKKNPYEVNCLFISNQTGFSSSQISKGMKEILQNIPFVVSFSPFMDESSQFADIILPDTSYFERWQDHPVSSLLKIPVLGIGQPVVGPLYESKPLEDIILTIAKKLGPPLSENLPWESFKELLFYRLEGLFEARQGSVFALPYEETHLRIMQERGWWMPHHDSLGAFMKDLVEKGGWLDPSYHFDERGYMYQTSSRRFELPSFRHLQENLPEISGDEDEYPYLLHLYDLPFTSTGTRTNLPWYQETIGFRFRMLWKTWVEVNPETAKELKIRDKDSVWVESPHAKIKAVAKVFPGAMPRVVNIPVGKEEDIPGQEGFKKRDHPLTLIGEAYDRQTGMVSRQSTRVKIYKHRE